jgi:gentisate 1,2-dioxygenase
MANLDVLSMPDRDVLSKRTGELGLVPYWIERDVIENPASRARAVPFCWKWRDMYPLLESAAVTVPVEEAYRRTLLFVNPGLRPKPWMTTTIYGGYSWYNPGEAPEVHRHQPSASRFVLSGDGGFTTVEGEKCRMLRGDLVITPNGTWHNHGNDGKEPVIWIDVLDLPVVELLHNSWKMDYEYFEPAASGKNPVKRPAQSIDKPADYSAKVYGTGGIKAKSIAHRRGQGHGSPMYVYRWKDTLTALDRLREFPADPCSGIAVEYVNPLTGGPVLPTLSYEVNLFRPGEQPDFQRKTASTVFCAIQGRGVTQMDGATISWEQNDVFVIPSWTWYRHINIDPKQEVMLYAVSDEPTLEKLELLVHQRRTSDGTVIDLIG